MSFNLHQKFALPTLRSGYRLMMSVNARLRIFSVMWLILASQGLAISLGQDESSEKLQNEANENGGEISDPPEGHSLHGEAFNEGPRQSAVLMEGMGNVFFHASTSSPQCQSFINQGVAQLHGFWYYEAERSFRQAARLDPDCAISYWGMARANVNNLDRARDFIVEAVKRKGNASVRERMFIEASHAFLGEEAKDKKVEKKQRAEQFTRDLEKIVLEFPDDIEAKAFLALQLWENERNDLPIVSHVAIDSIIEDIFDQNPLHPAHHYRIHLWDKKDAAQALKSAALCGPSLPGIAHMWHMPGHTYSKLHRYSDAAWQQEASARVDHAHMIRYQLLPDQIHNFAHNNEWLIRNLLKIGRIDEAVALAKNMVELPRHPKYNTLKKGSAKYGRERLLEALATYRLWPQLVDLAQTNYLEPTEEESLQVERLRHLGIAHAFLQQHEQRDAIRTELAERLKSVETDRAALEKEPTEPEPQELATTESQGEPEELSPEEKKREEEENKKREKEKKQQLEKLKSRQKALEQALAALDAVKAANDREFEKACELYEKAGEWDPLVKAEWLIAKGDVDEGIKLLDREVKENPQELLPLAVRLQLSSTAEKHVKELDESFDKIRQVAVHADLHAPPLAKLGEIAESLGYTGDWRAKYEPARDLGRRPSLDSLGPFRWQPQPVPAFEVVGSDGEIIKSDQLIQKPTLVIFYLGSGCLHCVEQLQKFAGQVEKFREHRIEIVGISSETLESLKMAIERYEEPLGITLHADQELKAFKTFRCYDDFEEQPLHGIFLVDAKGLIRWHDIGFEPFMDSEFLLSESSRLLSLSPP